MLVETLWLLPVAAIYLFGIADSPTSHMGQNAIIVELTVNGGGCGHYDSLLCFTGALHVCVFLHWAFSSISAQR